MKYIYSTLRRAAVHRRVWQQQRHQHRPRRSKRTPRPPQVQRRGVPVPVRSVSPVQSTDFVPLAWSSGRLKKRAFDEMLSRERFRGRNPHRNRPALLSHKTVYHAAIYGSQKKTVQRRLDLVGNAEETMTKYWVLARGGAWRNPKPAGGPYVCEQCRLDACGGNDRTLTLQAVTTIELTPADVCADCGARLLEEREVKDRA